MSKKRVSCSDVLFMHKVKYTCMLHQPTPTNPDSAHQAQIRKSASTAYLREINIVEQLLLGYNAEESQVCYLTEADFRRFATLSSTTLILFGGIYIKLVEFTARSSKFPKWGLLLKELDIG